MGEKYSRIEEISLNHNRKVYMSKRSLIIVGKMLNGIFTDPSALTLIVANVYTAYISMRYSGGVVSLYSALLFQLIILGAISVIKITLSQPVSDETYTVLGKKKQMTRFSAVVWFTLVYGLLLIFLTISMFPFVDLGQILSAFLTVGWVYLVHHIFSLGYNYYQVKNASTSKAIMLPVARVMPIVAGVGLNAALSAVFPIASTIVFVALKTIGDLFGHYLEHARVLSTEELRTEMKRLKKEYPEIYN